MSNILPKEKGGRKANLVFLDGRGRKVVDQLFDKSYLPIVSSGNITNNMSNDSNRL